MASDAFMFGHDMGLIGVYRQNGGEPQPSTFHQSIASRLLKEDVKQQKHKQLAPKQLWSSRIEYQDFSLKVFRDHVYQEADRLTKQRNFFQKKALRTSTKPSQE